MEHDYPFRPLCDSCRSQTDLPVLSLPRIDPNLLHSNYVPSKAEVSQTLELLEGEIEELEQCDIDIASLRRKLDQMETRKRHIETRIARRRAIISAHRKLPVEIWEAIFANACACSASHSLTITTAAVRHKLEGWTTNWAIVMAPIFLTHVCSRWRDITIGYPKLWSSISIKLCNGYPRQWTKLVETFLERSAPCPLDFRIQIDPGFSGSSDAQAAWEVLAPYLARSHRLLFSVDHCSEAARVLATFHGQDINFNNLASFQSEYGDFPSANDNGDADIDNPFWHALRAAPKLTNVVLQIVHPRNLFPYPQLTTLVITFLTPPKVVTLLRILEVSGSLHSLIVANCGTFGHINDPLRIAPRRVELFSLHTLSINFEENRRVTDGVRDVNYPTLTLLFTSLVMPSLSTFKLGCSASDSPMTRWPSSLLTMLRCSSGTLRDMSVLLSLQLLGGDTYHTWESLSVLLRATPNLNHFDLQDFVPSLLVNAPPPSVNYIFPSDSLLSELSFTSHNSPILPDLETVVIRVIRLNPDIMNKILDLAALRSPSRLSVACSIRPLRKLHIVPYYYYESKDSAFILEPRMLEVIAGLSKEGVEVVIEEGCSML